MMLSKNEINDMVKACAASIDGSCIIVHPSGEWQLFSEDVIGVFGYDENSKPGDRDEKGGFLLCWIESTKEKEILKTITDALKRENMI